MEFKYDLLNKVGDITVSRTMKGDGPLVCMRLMNICHRRFDMGEGSCAIAVDNGTVYCCPLLTFFSLIR